MNSPGNCLTAESQPGSPLHVDCALSQVISVTAARTHTFAPRTLLLVTIKERKNKKERKKKHDWTATAFPNRPKRDGALLAEAKERKKSFLFPEKTRLQPQDSLSGKTEKKTFFKGPSQLFQKQRFTKALCGELDQHQELQRGHALTSCAFVRLALSSSSLKECGPGARRAVRSTLHHFLLAHCTGLSFY